MRPKLSSVHATCQLVQRERKMGGERDRDLSSAERTSLLCAHPTLRSVRSLHTPGRVATPCVDATSTAPGTQRVTHLLSTRLRGTGSGSSHVTSDRTRLRTLQRRLRSHWKRHAYFDAAPSDVSRGAPRHASTMNAAGRP